jgi:hypothetical protein
MGKSLRRLRGRDLRFGTSHAPTINRVAAVRVQPQRNHVKQMAAIMTLASVGMEPVSTAPIVD